MSDETQTSIPGTEPTETETPKKPRKPRTVNQRWHGMMVDIEEEIPTHEGMRIIREGENSAVVVFDDKTAMNAFLLEYCDTRSPSDDDNDIEFKIKTGGFIYPITGRGMKVKKSLV